jgi:hypothetical protein
MCLFVFALKLKENRKMSFIAVVVVVVGGGGGC